MERVKLRTSIFVSTFIGLTGAKGPLKISRKVAVGVVRDSRKFSGQPITNIGLHCRARRAGRLCDSSAFLCEDAMDCDPQTSLTVQNLSNSTKRIEFDFDADVGGAFAAVSRQSQPFKQWLSAKPPPADSQWLSRRKICKTSAASHDSTIMLKCASNEHKLT